MNTWIGYVQSSLLNKLDNRVYLKYQLIIKLLEIDD